MRSHAAVLTSAAVALAVMAAAARPQELLVRSGRAHRGAPLSACDTGRERCQFTDPRQTNSYVVTDRQLARLSDSKEVYRVDIAGGVVRARLAAMNPDRTELAVLLVQESMATGSLFNPGAFAPDTVHRQYTVSIRNPKTGAEIKAIDLGMLKPDALALPAGGDYVWVAGDELQLRRREVRAYNTRSGKLEHMTPLPKGAPAKLFEDGFDAGGVSYVVEAAAGPAAGAPVRHMSANPYSIAEFSVTMTAPLSTATFGGEPIAVVGFEGADGDLKELLESALAVKLSAAGFAIVERKRIKELLQEAQFQNMGITDSKSASELGRMANAKFLVFGTLRTTGTSTLMALRLVGVEDGTQHAAIALECRDCKQDDYLQGLGFLASDWIVAR